MKTSGKLVDVLIEEVEYKDMQTGMPVTTSILTVWADNGYQTALYQIEGIYQVSCNLGLDRSPYTVYFDPRYDRQWIKNEIEAAIKCNAPKV